MCACSRCVFSCKAPAKQVSIDVVLGVGTLRLRDRGAEPAVYFFSFCLSKSSVLARAPPRGSLYPLLSLENTLPLYVFFGPPLVSSR